MLNNSTYKEVNEIRVNECLQLTSVKYNTGTRNKFEYPLLSRNIKDKNNNGFGNICMVQTFKK